MGSDTEGLYRCWPVARYKGNNGHVGNTGRISRCNGNPRLHGRRGNLKPSEFLQKDSASRRWGHSKHKVVTVIHLFFQKRFFLKDADSYDSAVYWWVPINWATASAPDYSVTVPTTWIPANESISITTSSTGDDWILLNKQQTGAQQWWHS